MAISYIDVFRMLALSSIIHLDAKPVHVHTLNFLYEMWGQICACQSHEQNATEHVLCSVLGWWESWDADWLLTTVSANKSYVSTNDRLLVGACHQLDNWECRF